nr:GTP-binding protein [Candidatus Njordarchaeota archaeon]
MKGEPPLSPIQPRLTEIVKILVIGEGGVGKTSLIHRLVTGRFSDQPMTIGLGFASKTMRTSDGRTVKLQVWDVGGQPRFRLLLPSAKGGAKGVLLVFDLSRPSTFVRLHDWVRLVRTGPPPEKHLPIVLVGAKCDLARNVLAWEARQFAARNNLDGYIETSSKENINVEKPFERLLQLFATQARKAAT